MDASVWRAGILVPAPFREPPVNDSSADRDPLDRPAEEFVARFRAGQRPSVNQYAQRHPGFAEQIHALLPALAEMEQLKPATGEHTGASPRPRNRPTRYASASSASCASELAGWGRVRGHAGVGQRHVALKLLPAESLLDPRRLERFRREARAARNCTTRTSSVFGVGEPTGATSTRCSSSPGTRSTPSSTSQAAREVGRAASRPARCRSGRGAPDRHVHRPRSSRPSLGPAPYTLARRLGRARTRRQSGSSPVVGTISGAGHVTGPRRAAQAQVADGVAYAHAQGILHRDIKPANLLLDLRGTVWVTDFGLAKATDADDLTHTGDVVGTLRYMAPERFDGPGDARADVYALGLTLYELLTLKPAFAAETQAKLVEQVLAASPPKPRAVNPQIPRDLETIVLKAIARDPALRYQSAAELADDLRRFTEDRPIRARRASSAEQAWRWCRRNKAVASLLAAVLVVFAVGAAVSAFFAVRAASNERDARTETARADDNASRRSREDAIHAREDAKGRATELLTERDMTGRLLYINRINLADGPQRQSHPAGDGDARETTRNLASRTSAAGSGTTSAGCSDPTRIALSDLPVRPARGQTGYPLRGTRHRPPESQR